jgi:DNA invertase Pin-like site-specific DNA recombinase
MKIAYIRVSTLEQNLGAQRQSVIDAGAEKVFEEKLSGRTMKNRPQLNQMLSILRKGDEVIIKKLCRLGRSLSDLHTIANKIKEAGATFKVIDQNIDTSTPTGELLFNLLGSLGQFELSLIKERMAEGKKFTGRYGGRPKSTNDKQNKTIYKLYEKGAGLKELSENYHCSRMTIWRKIQKEKVWNNRTPGAASSTSNKTSSSLLK